MKLKFKVTYMLVILISSLILLSLSVAAFLVDSIDVTQNVIIGNIDVNLDDLSNNNFQISINSPTYYLDIENSNYSSEKQLKNINQFNDSAYLLPIKIINNSNVASKVDFFNFSINNDLITNGLCFIILPGNGDVVLDKYNYIKPYINTLNLDNINDLQTELQNISNKTINDLKEANFTSYNLNIIIWDEYYETWENGIPNSRYDNVSKIDKINLIINLKIKLVQANYYDGQ